MSKKTQSKNKTKNKTTGESKPITKILVSLDTIKDVSKEGYSLTLKQAYTSCPPSVVASDDSMNGTVALFQGIAPKNEIEAMLAAQMVACHNLSMEAVTRAGRGEQSLQSQSEHANQANKLMRTFAIQTEALSKLRGDSKTVIVKHVTVSKGGQAIIGDVRQGNSNGKK